MDVDIWSSNLSPNIVFPSFVECFMIFVGDCLPQVDTSREKLVLKYQQLKSLSSCLEDVSHLVLNDSSIRLHAKSLGQLIGSCEGAVKTALEAVTLDILVFACLIPCHLVSVPQHFYSLFSYKTAISRFAIRPISPVLLDAILIELQSTICFNHIGQRTIQFQLTQLLSHIDIEAYNQYNLVQRMFLISMAHLSSPLRKDLLSEKTQKQSLTLRIFNSPNLHHWMLACSDAEEQFFLNTCDIAASLSSIVSFHSSIASLIHLGNIICEDVERRMQLSSKQIAAYPAWWGRIPSQYEHVSSILDDFKNDMKKLDVDISAVLDMETHFELSPTSATLDDPPSLQNCSTVSKRIFEEGELVLINARRTFLTKWNRSLQRLSSVFYPDNPVVLTEKIYPNDWHRSAKWMTARALVDQFAPGKPSFLSRSEASRTLEQITCHYHHTTIAFVSPEVDNGLWLDFPENLSEEHDQDKKLDIIASLWNRIAFHDGILISSREHLFFGLWTIGHLSYWKAVKLGPKDDDRFFLVSDPELQYFKVLSLQQVSDYASDMKNWVNPTDGAAIQFRRAKRLRKED